MNTQAFSECNHYSHTEDPPIAKTLKFTQIILQMMK